MIPSATPPATLATLDDEPVHALSAGMTTHDQPGAQAQGSAVSEADDLAGCVAGCAVCQLQRRRAWWAHALERYLRGQQPPRS